MPLWYNGHRTKKFTVKMLDESSQIRDRKKLAERIKKLIDRYGVPEFLNKRDAFLLNVPAFGHHFDFIAANHKEARFVWMLQK